MSRWLPRFALPAAVAVGALFTLTPAAFAADPAGNNGSVKIESQDVDDAASTANDPHVPCDFQLHFFGFDKDQKATITFTIQPPSNVVGVPDQLHQDVDVVISDDDAMGDKNDSDAILPYSGNDFHLENYYYQPNQGWHIRLDVVSPQLPGGQKHKVFWIDGCTPPTTITTPPTTETSSGGGGGGSSSTDPGDPGTSTSSGGGGSLPLTGPAIGGIVAAGVGLVAAGTVLVVARRRRDATDAS